MIKAASYLVWQTMHTAKPRIRPQNPLRREILHARITGIRIVGRRAGQLDPISVWSTGLPWLWLALSGVGTSRWPATRQLCSAKFDGCQSAGGLGLYLAASMAWPDLARPQSQRLFPTQRCAGGQETSDCRLKGFKGASGSLQTMLDSSSPHSI